MGKKKLEKTLAGVPRPPPPPPPNSVILFGYIPGGVRVSPVHDENRESGTCPVNGPGDYVRGRTNRRRGVGTGEIKMYTGVVCGEREGS